MKQKDKSKDTLNMCFADDLKESHQQVKKYMKFGDVSNKVPVRVDARTTIYIAKEKYEKQYKNQ